MIRSAAALVVLLAGPASVSVAARGPFVSPQWLLRSEHRLLARTFGNAKPRRVYYIPYPRKIAVIFEFDRVVICGTCSSPSAQTQPRGKVVRVSFDRSTHELGGAADGYAIRFCEVDGKRPPEAACLRR